MEDQKKEENQAHVADGCRRNDDSSHGACQPPVFSGQRYCEGSAVLLFPQLHLPGVIHGHPADESHVHKKNPGSNQQKLQSNPGRRCIYGAQ